MRNVWRGVAMAAAFTFASSASFAVDSLIPGKITIVKNANLAKIVAKPLTFFPLPGSAPTGGSVGIKDTGAANPDVVLPLTGANWTALGDPPGSKGYKYKGAGAPGDACKIIVIKTTVIKAICKGTDITTPSAFGGNAAWVINTGAGDQYCAEFGGTPVENDPGNFKRKDAGAPGGCATFGPSCCGPQRITLTSGPGTLQLANLPPFPFPSGVTTIMDVAGGASLPDCQHNVVVPNGGFNVPNFDIPAINYCSSVVTLGCESGAGEGAGQLWDGNGAAGASLTNVTKVADTSDGVCNPPGQPCTTSPGGAGANTLGDIDSTKTATAAATGVRSALDLRVRSLTWSDSVCKPAITPGCCLGSNYNPADGDLYVIQSDFILSPTTGIASGAFVDKDGDGCKRAGAGFDTAAPGPDGPKTLTGSPAAGPCCVVGQATTIVSVGVGFSGGTPLFDLGFKSTIPNTVASCGSIGADTCVVTTDPCLN